MRTPRIISRRTLIDRWIASLTPLCEVINRRANAIGVPAVNVGPTPIGPDRIRRGAVWFVDGQNVGFHVDFLKHGAEFSAWAPDRRITLSTHGKLTQALVERDLAVVTEAVGLVARPGVIQEQVVPVTRRQRQPLDSK